MLLNDFPNPERKGCPDSETIRAIAFGKIKGDEARRWRIHAATCSPCTREYVNFRTEAERARRRRLRVLAAIAVAVILAVIAGWVALNRLGLREGWQEATLDLRGHEALRGSEQEQHRSPLALARGELALTIDLPVGSEAGDYDVQVVQDSGRALGAASGRAELVEGVTVLRLRLDLRRGALGPASLLMRQSGHNWARYAVFLK